jgi:hypothetical protein
MRALLLDEETSDPERRAERPLLLQRDGEADTGAVAPPRATGTAREKTGSPPGGGQGSSARRAGGGRASAPASVRADPAFEGSAPFRGSSPGERLPGLGAEHAGHGVGASVIPGLGTVNAGHIGATVGLLHGVVSHTVGQHHPNHDSTHQQLATRAQQDPARYGADLLLHGHNRKRYEELARAERLPSQVWAQHEANGQLEGHLRRVHERYGEQLHRLYRHRPMGERAILGLAAASGAAEDVARALDALRVHHHYPARVSFPRLVHGFSSPEIARIAAAFLPGHGGSETVVEAYRAVRAAREQAHRARRRLLFRRLREQWASERPTIIPLFEGVTRGFSPAQTERLRLVLESGGDAEVVFEELENDNHQRRIASVEAAFRRWLAEWEASHHPSAQTPLQEPHIVLDAIEEIPSSRPPIVLAEAAVEPAQVVEADPDRTPDSERQLVLQRGPSEGDAPAEQDKDVDPGATEEPEETEDEAGALHGLHAPPPGAYAADGVLPWGHFTQGFGHRSEERLRRAWEGGRQWHSYRELLASRGEELRVAREAAFLRHMARLGCAARGPCRLDRRHLAALAPLGAGFTPEQWARLGAALTEGTLDPLEVWRDVERENVAEAVSVREPAFLRYVGAWGHAPHRNPVEWARTAPRLRRLLREEESAGLFDDQGGDVGSLGEEDRPEEVSTDAQGIGALFGGGAGGEQGTLEALGGSLRGFAEQALGALTGRTAQNRPVADPTRSLDEAAGLLDDAEGPLGSGVEDVLSTVDKSVHALFGGSDGAPRPPGSGAVVNQLGGVAEQAGLDLQRVLASWGGPQSKLGEQTVRGLTGIGLTDLAATHPSDLLRIVAGHRPSSNEPSGWWGELTAAQGLSESAEEELRKAIDADGPKGVAHTISTYVRLLKDATDAQKGLRDALFTTILETAQRIAGPTFDPTRLPGGDPFVLLSQNTGDWPRVVEAMKSGNGLLAVFRQIEDARQNRLLQVDAPEWMRRMLSALWEQRHKAGWVPDGAGGKNDDAGAVDHAPSGGHAGNPPSGGHVGNAPSGGHAGNAPSGGHAGNAPSGTPGNAPSGGHAGSAPSGGHAGSAPSGGHAGSAPSGGHAGNAPSGHQGNGQHSHEGNGQHGHQGNSPWGHPGTGQHGHEGSWQHGHQGHSPWGHQGRWEHGHQGHSPWGHPRTWEPGRPWIMPWGHQGTWEPAHDTRRHEHGHGSVGKAVLGALLLPFPFNLLLGHKHHREVVRHEPSHGVWYGAPHALRHDPFRDVFRPTREVVIRESLPAPLPKVVWSAPPVREVVREVVREPLREIVREPFREVVWRAPLGPRVRREVVVNFRPRPLYHLSFGRPMSEHELRRYLTFVPQLRAHPDGVLAEMAGLHGQARDVRGVDATTGEYLLLPGETLADIAHKLVGERRRWRELEAANPMRAEGDPRVRLPPSWFGYVPYSVPLHRIRELHRMRRHGETGDPNQGEVLEAGDAQEDGDDAGLVRDRVARRGARRGTYRPHAPVPGFGAIAFPEAYEGHDPNGDEPDGDSPDAEDASGPGPVTTLRRRYRVTHFDALGTVSPTYGREVAEQIVMQHNLFDGHRLLRPSWWAELREVNPQKPLSPDGWWRDIHEGEVIWIPDSWPLARPEPGPDAADTGGVLDALGQFAPFPAPPPSAKATALPPENLGAGSRAFSGQSFPSAAANTGVRQNLTRQTYTIVRGDWPQKIAQRFGASRRTHWLTELEAANQHKSVESGIGNWVSLYAGEVVNIPDAWVSTDTGEEEDNADAGALRQNLTMRTYAVVAGDGMQRIAQKLGAASTGRWFSELRDANPHKKMAANAKGKQLGWESLTPGEILNIPDAWPDTPRLRPAPGGTPTHAPYPGLSQFPAFPGGAVPSPTAPPGTVPAAATVDPGTILRVQAILIAFRQVHPEAIVPKDFGTGMPFSPDATGVLTPRTQKALASFQRLSNTMAGSHLRTDGVLDPDTIAALDSFSAQAIGGLTQRPAVVPVAGAAPASGNGNPLAGILGAATAAAGDFARRVAPPAAPPAGHGTDPFAGAFGSAGDLPHPLERDAPPDAPPAPRRPGVDPRPAQPPLDELQGTLQQYGIPGVPGLPGGAPHAPRPRRPRVDAPTAPAPEEPSEEPARVAAPVAKKAANDDSVVPLVLTGLGLLAGVFV